VPRKLKKDKKKETMGHRQLGGTMTTGGHLQEPRPGVGNG